MATHPTITFQKPSAEERFRVLPSDATVADVTFAARSAGLAFVAGAARGWDRGQLRSWLFLDYEPATVWTRTADGRTPFDPVAGLDDVEVSMLVEATRQTVLRMIHAASVNWRVSTFARDMIDARLTVAVYDRTGAEAYAPAIHPDMRLKDRVASLFVSDYLSNRADYDRVVQCDACGEVAIGTRPRHLPWCAEPPARSGIVERSRDSRTYHGRSTIKGVG